MDNPDDNQARAHRAGNGNLRAGTPGAAGRDTVAATHDDDYTASIGKGLLVFTTTPPSTEAHRGTYIQRVGEIARWSEAAGCEGTLIYTDNSLVDPWLVSQAIVGGTRRLCPLVAVQPLYMHPYTAAKMVASLAFMYGRRIWLNVVAGGFVNDLIALGDNTPHDERYRRATEYVKVVLALLTGERVSLDGPYYRVKNLRLTPQVPEHLWPGLLMSGSSEAGLAAARAIGAVPVKYPQPPGEERANGDALGFGVRIGIIARESDDEAWAIALARFPPDRRGKIAHQVAMSVSDSHWHGQLSAQDAHRGDAGGPGVRNPYWLEPFKNYKTFCPYLVGAYEDLAELVAGYLRLGARTVILDTPLAGDDLHHAGRVLDAAVEAIG
jgi:alkanesulfonate monooxygenase